MGTATTSSATNRLYAGGLAVLAFFGSLLGMTLVLAELLTFFFAWGHPGDRSVSDSTGWALIMLSPLLLPVLLYVAGILACRTYRRVMDKASAE